MKILDLCEFFSERGGGVRSYLGKQLKAATQRGHEVVVVAPGPNDETIDEGGGRIVRYAAPRMPYDPTYHWPLRVDQMRAIVRRERPDVLQVSSPFVPAAVAATLEAPLKVYVHHSDPIGCYLRPLARRVLGDAAAEQALGPAWALLRGVTRSVDATVVAGHWLERLLTQQGCQRVRTVPFGFDHGDFGPERADASLRARLLGRLADVPDARLLLVAGRLAADKRQRLVVEAALQVARRRPLALVVLGDGPERPLLERLARRLPAATFISFTRDRAEYAALLASADALGHASLCETYGFVIVETLASGTPVVVPAAGAAGDLADPAAAEVYPARGEVPDLALALDRLFARDRETLRRSAVAAAARQPSTAQHFDALFSFYGELLARGRRPGRGGDATVTPVT